MAEHCLDKPNVGAVLKHQRRHGVAEQMTAAVLSEPGRFDVLGNGGRLTCPQSAYHG